MNEAQSTQSPAVLVEVKRGAIIESRHSGAVVAVEPDGHIIAQLGDADWLTSTRSTIKAIQAIPVITSGAADRFHFSARELALVCASHSGEIFHTETVAALLERLGLTQSALRCGAHPPYNEEAARQLQCEGRAFTQLHNNCSGKHTGMLATCVHRGWSTDDYLARAHPLQQEILARFRQLGDLPEALPIAIDGCSAPTFGVPLRALALAFARLASFTASATQHLETGSQSQFQGIAFEAEVMQAASRLVKAMMAYPEMVGGTGRLDTALMRAARGALVCKIGAEATYVIGVLPCDKFPKGLGLAIKIHDGAARALGTVVLETLIQLGVLDAAQQAELHNYHRPVVSNHRGLTVGEIVPVFKIESEV
ncbi:MAG: asparaginase [Acidobacteria bacterium]|nr:asparaginase [Acidobacteriota bacterium]